MLNPTFPKKLLASIAKTYVAPEDIASRTVIGNESFDTGCEYRLQSVYGEEIWLKLERAGLTPEVINKLSVLEVCAGSGFLTFQLLSRCKPNHITVNDISASEMGAARKLIESTYPDALIEWILGDMHKVAFDRKFDLIIGNSFLHHFYNIPQVLFSFQNLLNPGGVFITLHEPTPMSTIVEGAKILAWPLAVLAPGLVNNIARARYKGEPSATDLWMFEPTLLKEVALQSGFRTVDVHPWHLFRPMVVQRNALHLSVNKPQLSLQEVRAFSRAIKIDAVLNRLLPHRCFGSLCMVCRK